MASSLLYEINPPGYIDIFCVTGSPLLLSIATIITIRGFKNIQSFVYSVLHAFIFEEENFNNPKNRPNI